MDIDYSDKHKTYVNFTLDEYGNKILLIQPAWNEIKLHQIHIRVFRLNKKE